MRIKTSIKTGLTLCVLCFAFVSPSMQKAVDGVFMLRPRDEASPQTFEKCPSEAFTKAQECMHHVNDLESQQPGGPCKEDDVKCKCIKVQGLADCTKNCPNLLQGAASAYATASCRGQKDGIKIQAFGGPIGFNWDKTASQPPPKDYPKPQSGTGKNSVAHNATDSEGQTTGDTHTANNATNSSAPASPVDTSPTDTKATNATAATNSTAALPDNTTAPIGPTTPVSTSTAPVVSTQKSNAAAAQAQIAVSTLLASAVLALLSYYL